MRLKVALVVEVEATDRTTGRDPVKAKLNVERVALAALTAAGWDPVSCGCASEAAVVQTALDVMHHDYDGGKPW